MSKIKRKKRDKQGFTLIELLAVIVILGVLLLISVPAVSKYIENSKKTTYIHTLKSMVSSVSTAVNAMELPFSIGINEGAIIPFSEIELEKTSSTKKSPYANWIEGYSYVLVIFDGERYKYYVSALDEAGYAIPLVDEKEMTTTSITMEDEPNTSLTHVQHIIQQVKVITIDSNNIVYSMSSENIIKVKISDNKTYEHYDKGNRVTLQDGSQWIVLEKSSTLKDRINLISYYGMSLEEKNYGLQDPNNPKVAYHNSNVSPFSYENSQFYGMSLEIIAATRSKLDTQKVNMSGADIRIPDINDFVFGGSYPYSSFNQMNFWVNMSDKGKMCVVVAENDCSMKNYRAQGSIRIVIKDLLKSNIKIN